MKLSPDHLAAFIVIFVFSSVVLWLIFREAEVIKLNINVEPDALLSPHRSINGSTLNSSLFQLVWRGTKEFPTDWDVLLTDFLGRREQFAVAIQLFGRKLTFIVDTRDQIIKRGERGRINLTFVDLETCSDLRDGFGDIKLVCSSHDGDLDKSKSVHDEFTEESSGNT